MKQGRGMFVCARVAFVLIFLIGCGGGESSSTASDAGAHASSAVSSPSADAGPRDPGPPRHAFAKKFVVNVRERPARDGFRIGYLRGGAIVDTKSSTPAGHDGCIRGWYELSTGGFVCDGRDVVLYDGRRPPERPATHADRDASLPYVYAVNRRDGTPVYRRLPTDEEAAQYEGYVIPGLVSDAGVPSPGIDPTTATEAPAPIDTPPAPASDPALAAAEEGSEEPLVPTLESLRGDRESVLMRRLVKGFYVSLDRDVKIRSRRYWRSLSNGIIPYARLFQPVRGSEFRGTELRPDGLTLPVGFAMSGSAAAYRKDERGRLRRARALSFREVVGIAGEERIGGRDYVLDKDGLYYRASELRRIDMQTPPGDLMPNEKWIDVDLERQSLVAYEGTTPVYVTLISSGRIQVRDNPLFDHRTPTGDFRITSKHVATTMDGDHAVDGPYSIEDVPYVMYFQLAYALHSAFWHNRFGYTKSHGCVNMAPLDARWVFQWTLPAVPLGWHGAYPTATQPGTRLIIHGEAPGA